MRQLQRNSVQCNYHPEEGFSSQKHSSMKAVFDTVMVHRSP